MQASRPTNQRTLYDCGCILKFLQSFLRRLWLVFSSIGDYKGESFQASLTLAGVLMRNQNLMYPNIGLHTILMSPLESDHQMHKHAVKPLGTSFLLLSVS